METITLRSLRGQAEFPTDYFHLANLYLLAEQFGWQPAGARSVANPSLLDSRPLRQDPTTVAKLIQSLSEGNLPPGIALLELAEAMLDFSRAAQVGAVGAEIQDHWNNMLDSMPQNRTEAFDPEAFFSALQHTALLLSGEGYYSPGYLVSRRDTRLLARALTKALPYIPAMSRQVRFFPDPEANAQPTEKVWIAELTLADSPDPLDFFGGRRQYLLSFVLFVRRGPYVIV